jgi:hypothetical protein
VCGSSSSGAWESPMVAEATIPENGMDVFGDSPSFSFIAYTTITICGDPFSQTITDPTQINDFLRDNTTLRLSDNMQEIEISAARYKRSL